MTDPAPETGSGDVVVDQGMGLLPQFSSEGQEPLIDSQGQQGQQDEIKLNPAWNNLLGKLPAGLHGLITPELKQWDQNYNNGIQKVHSQYAPWKPFIDQQVAPEDVNNSLLIYNALNENPQALIQQLIDYYKYEIPQQSGQGQVDPQQEIEEEIPYDITQHPEFQRMAQLVELLGQNTLTQHEQILQQQADEQVEQEFAAAREQHGDFDEAWVAQFMYLRQPEDRKDINAAIEAYRQFEQGIIARHQNPGAKAPVMMGGGGGLPSQQIPISQLDSAGRKKLIAETLARASQNGG
jgi:hypothetical protein